MAKTILEMRDITKIFPGVKALDRVRFELREGEIHALVGENGAGKSTFIKVLAGVHLPDGGEIYLDGKKVEIKDPQTAAKFGIAAIHQHAASYPDLSVAENIFIGHEFMTGPFINWRKANVEATKLLERVGANFKSTDTVGNLSVAQQQLVEIAKALSQNARILIMDEPTAALSKRESEDLYEIARKLRDEGTAIILISHRFEDIFGLADRATVFRDGTYIGMWDIAECDANFLVEKMVGRDINQFYPKTDNPIGEEIFRIENFSRTGFFRDINMNVHAGEIVGLTGLVGAGRTEVVEAAFGATKADSGTVYLDGKPVKVHSPTQALELGMALLPENRQIEGLLLSWSINDNISLPTLDDCTTGIALDRNKENAISKDMHSRLRIKAPTVDTGAGTLSGGNQQKVVVGKILAMKPKVIILDEPTKGVDVGAKAAIYEIMSQLAGEGIGILMISSELPEVMNMSDRIYVMSDGHMTAEFKQVKGLTQAQILEKAMPSHEA